MPVFDVRGLVEALEQRGFHARVGDIDLDIHPARRAYFERWLSHRDGFLRLLSGNVDFIGVEEVVRMGPFFDVHCILENGFIADNDLDAHRLLDAAPYYQLSRGHVTTMGWSGGIISSLLAQDEFLSAEFRKNVMREEVRKISLQAADYCCVIRTKVWDHEGAAQAFEMVDRIAMVARKLIKQVHLGEKASQ